jgi:hypothetical protein
MLESKRSMIASRASRLKPSALTGWGQLFFYTSLTSISRFIGYRLHQANLLPLCIFFVCGVPAIVATRLCQSLKDPENWTVGLFPQIGHFRGPSKTGPDQDLGCHVFFCIVSLVRKLKVKHGMGHLTLLPFFAMSGVWNRHFHKTGEHRFHVSQNRGANRATLPFFEVSTLIQAFHLWAVLVLYSCLNILNFTGRLQSI